MPCDATPGAHRLRGIGSSTRRCLEQALSPQTQHLQAVLEKHGQDMAGKTVAITGTTSGTGFVCARELAKAGATVILLNRESDRAEAALIDLQAELPSAKFDAVTCNLQDFGSVRAAIATIKERYDVLDVLCNNAGVMAFGDHATKDGYDVQMQTNCISHFLLTKGLWSLLEKSADARIVNHTSMARLGAPLEAQYFEARGGELGGDGTEAEIAQFTGPRWDRYHQTKLANCAFTYGLKQRMDAKGITNIKPLVAHPGLSATNLQVTTANQGGMNLDGPFMQQAQSAEDGATGIIRCCIDPQAKSGDFYGPESWRGFPDKIDPEPMLMNEHNLRVNWDGCEAAVGKFDI